MQLNAEVRWEKYKNKQTTKINLSLNRNTSTAKVKNLCLLLFLWNKLCYQLYFHQGRDFFVVVEERDDRLIFFFSTFPLAFIMLHYISRNAWTPQWLYDYNCAVYSKSCILSGIFFFQISLRRLFKKDLIIVTSVGLILNFTQ